MEAKGGESESRSTAEHRQWHSREPIEPSKSKKEKWKIYACSMGFSDHRAAAYFHRRKIYWHSEWNERSREAYRKSPSSPLLYGLRDTLSHSCSKTKLNAKKLYIICSFAASPSFQPDSSFTVRLWFYFVYYVKRIELSSEWIFILFQIFFFSSSSVVVTKYEKFTFEQLPALACRVSSAVAAFFLTMHSTLLSRMAWRWWWWWGAEEGKESNKRRVERRNISDLANIRCMEEAKKKNEIELLLLKTSHFHFYNFNRKPDGGKKKKEQRNSCNFILNDVQMSDGILFLPSISSSPASFLLFRQSYSFFFCCSVFFFRVSIQHQVFNFKFRFSAKKKHWNEMISCVRCCCCYRSRTFNFSSPLLHSLQRWDRFFFFISWQVLRQKKLNNEAAVACPARRLPSWMCLRYSQPRRQTRDLEDLIWFSWFHYRWSTLDSGTGTHRIRSPCLWRLDETAENFKEVNKEAKWRSGRVKEGENL